MVSRPAAGFAAGADLAGSVRGRLDRAVLTPRRHADLGTGQSVVRKLFDGAKKYSPPFIVTKPWNSNEALSG
ncbi:MAG: hypothetical protein NTZ14_14025 [Hyphomicrobiales bacterium]|nr:hypothetical protein [Hyphomicrobiales bacterium]